MILKCELKDVAGENKSLLAFSSRGEILFSSDWCHVGNGDRLQAWDVATGSALHSLQLVGRITHTYISPHSPFVLASTKSSTVLWNGKTGLAVRMLPAETFSAAAFMPTGDVFIAATGFKAGVSVWDLRPLLAAMEKAANVEGSTAERARWPDSPIRRIEGPQVIDSSRTT